MLMAHFGTGLEFEFREWFRAGWEVVKQAK